jgi:N utilization substance protein A
LQPAAVEEVFLYPRLGRAIVLVKEDQLSLAIGRRGQNVRLASKLVGWDIEIMTHDELTEGIERATNWFLEIPSVTDEMVETFIEEGFLSYDDLTFLEPAQLGELTGLSEEAADDIIAYAEEAAERVEEEQKAAHAEGGEGGRKKAGATVTAAEGARQAFESLFAAPPTAEADAEAPAPATEEVPVATEEAPAELPPTEEQPAAETQLVGPDVQVSAGPAEVHEPATAEPGHTSEENSEGPPLMSTEPQ